MQNMLYNVLPGAMYKLSLTSLQNFGSILGNLMWYSLIQRRKYTSESVHSRLSVDFKTANRISKSSFEHSCRSFMEIFYGRHVQPRFIAENIRLDKPELVSKVQKLNRPIVITTAHFGAWEIFSGCFRYFFADRRRQVVVRLPKDKALAQTVWQLRSLSGVEVVPHRLAASQVLQGLRQNGVAAFLVDHNCLAKEAVFLPFLGKVAAVNVGPALLALRAKAIVWPVFIVREPEERFCIYSHDFLDTASLTGSRKDRLEQIAGFYTQAVEDMVHLYPEQWFWMHKRWKTRPPKLVQD